MKIEEIRTSFTVYVIASEIESLGGMIESLGLAGYMVANFSELTAAFSELYSNPPHFVVFDSQEKKFDLLKAMQQVSGQLPESHVFLTAPVSERAKAVEFLEQGAYDLVFTPLVSSIELVRTFDRAAERDYFMYLNERLMQDQTPDAETSDVPVGSTLFEMTTTELKLPMLSEDFHLNFAHRLFENNSADECLRVFLESASHSLGGCAAVYFRYIPNRRVLLAGHAINTHGIELKGLGINFNEVAPGFRTAQLRDPMGIPEFSEMIREIFGVSEFMAWPVEAMGDLQGVVCFMGPTPQPTLSNMLHEWLTLLNKALSLVESEKRLHVVTIKDFSTDVLNRNTFVTKIGEEISRARRTRMPVSLLQIAVDQYGQLTSTYGPDETQMVMRTAARILEKQSRINDLIGRTGADEFGLILPHTDVRGAKIKAERLRRIFETADFEKVLKDFPHLTISLGISEYPTFCRDGEELLQSADEALYQVRRAGNKACVAKAAEGFEPDFTVPGKSD